MAAAIPFVVKAFAAVKTAAAAIGAKTLLGVTYATWGKVAMYAAFGASLLMKPPGLPSATHEISVQPAGPNAPLPILFGRTRTGGQMVFRDVVADLVHNSDKANNLVFQNVISVGPIGSISQYKIGENIINFNRDPNTGLAMCVGVQGFKSGSKVFKDGVHTVYTRGLLNDSRTVRTLTGENLSQISADHGMAGLATVTGVYKLDGSKNHRFPMGPPDWPTVLAEGLACYDPRKDGSNGVGSGSHRIDDLSTWQFSENPYIVALAYLVGGKGRSGHKSWGVGLSLEDIDLPSFIHGANVADANNWKVGGVVTSDDTKEGVLSNLLVAGAGQLIPSSKISVFVNEPKVSTFTLTQTMLVGSQTIRATRSMNNRTNRLVVKYREPNQDYAVISGPAIVDEAGVETDGGLRSSETTFALIQNATQAVQIGSYELVNSREYEVDLVTNMDAFSVEIGDAVNVDFAIGAIEAQQFIVKNKTYDHNSQTIEFTLVSETEGKHDFALGRTATAPAPAALKSLESLDPSAPSTWAIVATSLKSEDKPAVEANPAENIEASPAIIGQAIPAVIFEGQNTGVVSKMVLEVRPFDPDRTEANDEDDWQIHCEYEGTTDRITVLDVEAKATYDFALSYRTNMKVVSPRKIFGGVTIDGASFDWNDGVITNLPPVLSDLTTGGNIKAEFIELENEANATLQDAFDDLANAITDADDRLTQANSDLSNAVSDAWDIVGRSDAVGLRKAVVDLQETGPDGQLVGRVEVLEANEANANAAILNLQSAQVELENGLATKATTTQLNNLSGRVTSAENAIGGHATRLTNVEVAAAGKASVSDHNNLKAEVETARNGKSSLSAELTSVRQASVDGLAGKTSVSDHNALVGRVSTAETTVSGHATRLTNVELSNNGKATISDLNSLGLTVDGLNTTVSGHASRLTTVETSNANKVNVSDFNSLTATVNTKTTTRIWRQATDPVGAQVGDLLFKTSDNNRLFVLVAGQGWVMKANASATQTTIDFMADQIRFTNGSTNVQPFTVSGGSLIASNLIIRNAASGPRTDTRPNGLYVFDANRIRVKVGDLTYNG